MVSVYRCWVRRAVGSWRSLAFEEKLWRRLKQEEVAAHVAGPFLGHYGAYEQAGLAFGKNVVLGGEESVI
jgi:hypothetical protein